LTRASIFWRKKLLAKKMDCRVKPGNDDPTTGDVGLARREFITL
jgi:hypothetical protein